MDFAINRVTNTMKAMIDFLICKTKHFITKGFQYCRAFGIVGKTLFLVMLGTVNFQNQFCLCTKEINNKLIHGYLSTKLHRVLSQKGIPQPVFLFCSMSSQFLGAFCQICISFSLHYHHQKDYSNKS